MIRIAVIGTAGRREDGPKMTRELYMLMYNDFLNRVIEIVKTPKKPLPRPPGTFSPKQTNRSNPHAAYPDITLVSGGAAWADHLAVSLYLAVSESHDSSFELNSVAVSCFLYLPANFLVKSRCYESNMPLDPGSVANYYHHLFGQKMCADKNSTLAGIYSAARAGASLIVEPGFKNRNLLIAANCEHLIAYTWGEGHLPKDGGTRHTWDHCKSPKVHVPLSSLLLKEKS